VVVLGPVEELSVGGVHPVVVLAELDIEVGNPAKLAIDVSLFGQLGVVGHTGSLHVVLLVRVELSLRVEKHTLLVLEVLVEVLLKTFVVSEHGGSTYLVVLVVCPVEVGRRYVMSIVPVIVRETRVVCVALEDLLLGEADARLVLVLSLRLIEKFAHVFASERRLTIFSSHRGSHLPEDHHACLL